MPSGHYPRVKKFDTQINFNLRKEDREYLEELAHEYCTDVGTQIRAAIHEWKRIHKELKGRELEEYNRVLNALEEGNRPGKAAQERLENSWRYNELETLKPVDGKWQNTD